MVCKFKDVCTSNYGYCMTDFGVPCDCLDCPIEDCKWEDDLIDCKRDKMR